jgi:hypothetical protein
MRSLTICLIGFASIFLGALIGMWVRRLMPEGHLKDESREILKVGSGTIATLSALVLGLLVGSSKSAFDSTNALIIQGSTKILVLDAILSDYGPETKDARVLLQRTAASGVEMFWPQAGGKPSGMSALEKANAMEQLRAMIRSLTPATDAQKQLRSDALSAANDMLQMRWLLIEQAQGSLPWLLVLMLLFWLTMMHFSFGLLAPRNGTAVTVLFISALAMSGAVFLILEMSHPMTGFIRVQPTPMLKAIELMDARKS